MEPPEGVDVSNGSVLAVSNAARIARYGRSEVVRIVRCGYA